MRYPLKYLLSILILVSICSVGLTSAFNNSWIHDGDFEQTINASSNPYWLPTPGNEGYYPYYSFLNASSSPAALYGNWSGYLQIDYATAHNFYQCVDVSKWNGTEKNFTWVVSMVPNAGPTCQAYAFIYQGINLTTRGSYLYNRQCGAVSCDNQVGSNFSLNVTIPANVSYIWYQTDMGVYPSYVCKAEYDNFGLIPNTNLINPFVSKAGNYYNFTIETTLDQYLNYELWANMSCVFSSPQQQVYNQQLSYDAVSKKWKALNVYAPNCIGNYNVSFFGNYSGLEISQPNSILSPNATLTYVLTVNDTNWAPNEHIFLTLKIYDTSNNQDMTAYVNRSIANLLTTISHEIIDPAEASHTINFYYNSGLNRYEANYTAQNFVCSGKDCMWAKDYLMNLTGITITGYEILDIKIQYVIPSFNISGIFYFDKDKTSSLTSMDTLLNGYTIKLVGCAGAVSSPQAQCGENDYGYNYTTTDANGKFSFSNMQEGTYILYPLIVGSYTNFDFESGYNNYYNSKWQQKAYKIITVDSSKNSTYYTISNEGIYAAYDSKGNLNFSFASHGSLLNFTAKNSSGAKLSGINIAVTALESVNTPQGITKSCTTGADGTCYVIVMDKLNSFPYGYRVIASGSPYATKTMLVSANDFNYDTNQYRGSYRTYSFNLGGGQYFITDINGNLNNITFSPANALAGEYLNYIRFKILDTSGISSYTTQYQIPFTPTGNFVCNQDECKITAIRLFFSSSAHDVGVPYCKLQPALDLRSPEAIIDPTCGYPAGGCIEFYGFKTQCNYECWNVLGGCGCKIKINGTEYDFDSTGKYLANLNMKKGDSFSYDTYCQGPLFGKTYSGGIVITSEEKRTSNFYRCDTFGQRCVEGKITVTEPAGCGSPADQWTSFGQYLYATQGSEEWNAIWVDGSQESEELWGSATADWKLTCNKSNTINVRIQDLDIDQTFYYTFGVGKWTENRYKEAFLNQSAQTLKFRFGLTSQLLGQPIYPTSANISVTELNSSTQYVMNINESYVDFTYGGVTDPAGTLYHYALSLNVPDYTYNMTSNTSTGIIYSSIDHYADVNCGLTPVTQVPGMSQEAFCRLKTINGTTITQTNRLLIKIDTSVGNAPYEVTVPFSSFDGDYNYYKTSITLINYSLAQSGLGAFYSLGDYAEGYVKMTISDPSSFYPFYDIQVPYKLDKNAINVEPIIQSVSLYKELVRPGVEPYYIQTENISTNDNILCNLTYSDTQNLVYNTSFELYGGSGNATQTTPAKYNPTTSAFGYSALWLFDLDSDNTFSLGTNAKFCCKGVLHYKWAGIDKTSSLTTCTITNPTGGGGGGGGGGGLTGGNWLDINSITLYLTEHPLEFVIAILLVIIGAPIIFALLR